MSSSTGLSRQTKQQPVSDQPVLTAIASTMSVDLVVNDRSEVWVLHDKPFASHLDWAEYDADLNIFTLVTEAGKIQPLGMAIPEKFAEALRGAAKVTTFLVQDKKVVDFYIIPMVVHHSGLN